MSYTQIAWVVAGGFLLVVEAIAWARNDPLLTDAMRSGSGRWLLWPAMFGCLSGHFFGSSSLPMWAAWLLVPVGAAVLARDLFIGSQLPAIDHLSICLLFMGLGAFLWGSR